MGFLQLRHGIHCLRREHKNALFIYIHKINRKSRNSVPSTRLEDKQAFTPIILLGKLGPRNFIFEVIPLFVQS
jgi:hypothetical protein